MTDTLGSQTADYSAYRRAGDLIYFSGLIAADPARGKVLNSFEDLPVEDRPEAGETGQMSIDMIQGPISAQTWTIFTNLRDLLHSVGGELSDVVHLNQYFVDLDDFPIYSAIRKKFFPEVPASTCLQVSGMLPSPVARVEVQAVAYLPRTVTP